MKIPMNVSVPFNAGLYYVDYNEIYRFHKKNSDVLLKQNEIPEDDASSYEFDQEASQKYFNDFIMSFQTSFCSHFSSMHPVDRYDKKKHIIAENKLFQIILEDNNWSVAVELLPVKKSNEGLQNQMFNSFLTGMKNALFEQFDTIYVRDASWSQIPITKNDDTDQANIFIQPVVEPAYAYDKE